MLDLYNGECLKLMDDIPDSSVDMVLCDLPYGVLDLDWDKVICGKELFKQYRRICKQNSNVLLFCEIKFAKYLMESAFKTEFSHCLIWVKNNKTRAKSANVLPMSQHEIILVFRINKYKNNTQFKEIRDYFSQQLMLADLTIDEIEKSIPNKAAHHWFRTSSDYRIPTQQNYKRLQEITGFFKTPYEIIKQQFMEQKNNQCTFNPGILESDVIYCRMAEKRVHPTQKPVSLLEKLIKAYSNKGDTVLDNCMGSGSTGVACVKTKRNFIGIELSNNYFEIAQQRIYRAKREENMPRQLSLFEMETDY